MPRTADENRKLFNEWAASYDSDVRKSFPLGDYAASRAQAVSLLPIQASDHYLDVGTGTGDFAALVAEHGATITAVDLSPAMLEQTRAKYPVFTLLEGSFKSLPVDNETFDGLTTSFAFHEIPPHRRITALREMKRVLKLGGMLCIVDVMFASQAAMDHAEKVLGRYWDPNEDYNIIGELDALLREAGFNGIQWHQTEPLHWVVIARK